MFADQELGIAPADQRQKEDRIGRRHYLARTPGKADHRHIDPGPDALETDRVARREHQARADEDRVGPGCNAELGASLQFVWSQPIWI